MPDDFPNDADGAALRDVASHSDLTKPMAIDFQVAMPDEVTANALADVLRARGYSADVYDSEECSLPWTCECTVQMLATHAGLLNIQRELADLSAPFGGFPDGWGTFGNG